MWNELEGKQDPEEARFMSRSLRLYGATALVGAVGYVSYELITGNISFDGTLAATMAIGTGAPSLALAKIIKDSAAADANTLANRGEV